MKKDVKPENQPKRPQRANGVSRFNALVEATEQLLNEVGSSGVTIQAVAKRAGVPMASVYHFFPSPVAACVAVAEKHLNCLLDLVRQASLETTSLENHVSHLEVMRATVAYYNQHPAARELILGSDYNTQIRHADLAANNSIALTIASSLSDSTHRNSALDLHLVGRTCVNICDAIWSLSVAETGKITAGHAREAERAITAYLSAVLQQIQNDND